MTPGCTAVEGIIAETCLLDPCRVFLKWVSSQGCQKGQEATSVEAPAAPWKWLAESRQGAKAGTLEASAWG